MYFFGYWTCLVTYVCKIGKFAKSINIKYSTENNYYKYKIASKLIFFYQSSFIVICKNMNRIELFFAWDKSFSPQNSGKVSNVRAKIINEKVRQH